MPTRAERQATAAQRRVRVVQARLAGATYEDIGRQLGVTAERAYQLWKDALRRSVRQHVEEYRTLELQRLDQLQLTATAVLRRPHHVIQGGAVVRDDAGLPYVDDGPVLAALTALLRIGESRRRLLGLDAPTRSVAQVGVTLAEATPADIDEQIARINAELAAMPVPTVEQLTEPPVELPESPPTSVPAPADVGGIVARVLERALDAAEVPDHRRQAAYRAAAAGLEEEDPR